MDLTKILAIIKATNEVFGAPYKAPNQAQDYFDAVSDEFKRRNKLSKEALAADDDLESLLKFSSNKEKISNNSVKKPKYDVHLADHLAVDRGDYDHHGIYAGKNMVIHYTELTEGDNKGIVGITSLEEFLDGSRTLNKVIHENPKFEPDIVIKRAKSRIGEADYNLIFNNCEHFCNWCIEDKAYSTQVRKTVCMNVIVPIALGVYKLLQK
ncbi:MAG: lecithin retinol acyltransferase family protein [Deltaproteobacteria bacterium]|jgi:hypothetical protein|nr:lecithin retinol acyltransferase family protein [Deltaproteobacteria bacterium]